MTRTGAGDALPEFTALAQRALALAREEAAGLKNHRQIGAEHVLLGLLAVGRGEGARLLRNHGADLASARREVRQAHLVGAAEAADGLLTREALSALADAVGEARERGRAVGTADVFLGVLRVAKRAAGGSCVVGLLERFGINAAREIPRVILAARLAAPA